MWTPRGSARGRLLAMRSLRVRNAILQVGAGVLLFAALELGARRFVDPPAQDPVHMLRLSGADGYEAIGQVRDAGTFLLDTHRLLQPDPRLLWRLRPDLDVRATPLHLGVQRPWTVRTSPEGFRDRALGELPEGERRVMVLGDSSSFGWAVEDHEAWPTVLEEALGEGWQVLNLAVPGFTSVQGRALAAEVVPRLPPDVVIAAFGANEPHQVLEPDAVAMTERQGALGQARRAAGELRLVQLGRRWLFRPWATGQVLAWRLGALQPRVSVAAYEEALEDLAGLAPQTVLVDVCTQPEYSHVMSELDRLRPDVDLVRYDSVHGETLDGCHPTPIGHKALAATLARLLESK